MIPKISIKTIKVLEMYGWKSYIGSKTMLLLTFGIAKQFCKGMKKIFCPSSLSSILPTLLELSFLWEWESGRTTHEIGQINQNCAINCKNPANTSNKNTGKSKNLSDIECILKKSMHLFARYRILSLIFYRTALWSFTSEERLIEQA